MKYKCNNCGSVLDTSNTVIYQRMKCDYCGKKNFSLLHNAADQTWVKIVNDFLKTHDFDCLKNITKKCYCEIDHLFECAFDPGSFSCVPGRSSFLTADYKNPVKAASNEQ